MMEKEIDRLWNRAWAHSFSRKKILFVLPPLFICGVLTVFCRTLAYGAGDWVKMSLTLLPVFLSSGILFAAGIILIRIYFHEVKGLAHSYRKTVRESWELMVGISYLSLPLLLAYLSLWTLLGFFYLLRSIPKIGEGLGVVLSFGPFLLVFGSLILSLLTLALLFLLTAQVALGSQFNRQTLDEMWHRVKKNSLFYIFHFCLGILPIIIMVGLLSLAAAWTGVTYVKAERSLSIGLQWFFLMIPYCALVSPAVVFFFNFSAECYVLATKK